MVVEEVGAAWVEVGRAAAAAAARARIGGKGGGSRRWRSL